MKFFKKKLDAFALFKFKEVENLIGKFEHSKVFSGEKCSLFLQLQNVQYEQ